MHKAYYTLDLTEAVLLKDHLVHNGVEARVENKGVVRIPGEFELCFSCGRTPDEASAAS
jgi:hypothetical protein